MKLIYVDFNLLAVAISEIIAIEVLQPSISDI